MKIKVERFGVLATAKALGAMYFLVSLVIFVPLSVFMMLAKPDAGAKNLLLLFLPLVYGGFSFVMIAVVCGLYNFLARYVGGIEFETSRES